MRRSLRPIRPVETAAAPAPDPALTLTAVAVLLAVGIAQAGDLLTFLRMVAAAGIESELNPIVARGAETLGVLVLVLAKVALVVLVAAAFAIVAREHRRVAAFVATFGMVAGLIGAFSNVLALA
jgi:hypothetical protein